MTTADDETFHYDEPGTLHQPGPIGRVIRLLFGALCLSLVWNVLVHGATEDLHQPGYWAWVVFGLLLAPYVVNIGLGVRWGAWPRRASLALLGSAALASLALTGEVLGEPLWWVVSAWLAYLYGHLGASFVLSAAIATPGCEMRAIPHLAGMMSRTPAREHYCPGFMDTVDRWERGELEAGAERSRDLMSNPVRMLSLYGIPFVALQLAGNLGGPLVGNGVPALALLFVGGVCLVNAWRCRRVHCVLIGPIFLVAGVLMALFTLRLIHFGPDTWSIIVNSALVAGFLVGCLSEHWLGTYLGGGSGDRR